MFLIHTTPILVIMFGTLSVINHYKVLACGIELWNTLYHVGSEMVQIDAGRYPSIEHTTGVCGTGGTAVSERTSKPMT
jgi:hypothetical protein